jgi:hypothetical protein
MQRREKLQEDTCILSRLANYQAIDGVRSRVTLAVAKLRRFCTVAKQATE